MHVGWADRLLKADFAVLLLTTKYVILTLFVHFVTDQSPPEKSWRYHDIVAPFTLKKQPLAKD
jgi:hypothetical protein